MAHRIRYNCWVQEKTRIAIMVGPKGRGSNMAAIARACADGAFPGEVACVVAPNGTAPAVENARSMGLHIEVVAPGENYGEHLLRVFHLHTVSLICLAGYLRLLPLEVLRAYPRRVLNIHPALLPKYGGKGMYGRHVHEAVLASGDAESGCSVHWVTENYDEGEVILQRKVPVQSGDTAETLAARVLQEEHIAYVEAIRKVLEA